MYLNAAAVNVLVSVQLMLPVAIVFSARRIKKLKMKICQNYLSVVMRVYSKLIHKKWSHPHNNVP